MGNYHTSTGETFNQQQVERRISEAKRMKSQQHVEEFGQYHCTGLNKNVSEKIDCSHTISVDDCKKFGFVELAWDLGNIIMESRTAHDIWAKGKMTEKAQLNNFWEKYEYMERHEELFDKKGYHKFQIFKTAVKNTHIEK